MFKLVMGLIVLGLLILMIKEWRKHRKQEKKYDEFQTRVDEKRDELEDIAIENVVMDYEEEIHAETGKLDERVVNLNNEVQNENK